MEGYCMKCRAKRDIKDAKQITMKNGRPAAKASVVIDGQSYTMFKILSKADAEKLGHKCLNHEIS